MRKRFYLRLALDNIRHNRQTYLPYLLTCIGTVAMFYILHALSVNTGIQEMRGDYVLRGLLEMATWVVGFFAVIFLFYTNRFLIRRRKKEFGLYSVLGMEKRHLLRVVFWETGLVALAGIVLGLAAGILLNKLAFMALLRIFSEEIPLGFEISFGSMGVTAALFAAIFLLLFISSLFQVQKASPIELLRSAEVGEREPKTRWLLALLGVVCLSSGYYLAISTENPVAALSVFFVAVILVIIGTYCLFIAGSIAVLKLLRRSKRYYYKTRHFVPVSGLLYRMKQNAAGLANICILSTMVLVMISSTLSLYLGEQDILQQRYPRSLSLSLREYDEEASETMHTLVEDTLAQSGFTAVNESEFTYLNIGALRQGDQFITDTEQASFSAMNDVYNLVFFPLDEYNRATGENRTLGEGEALLYANRKPYEPDTLSVLGETFVIREKLSSFSGINKVASNIASTNYLIVKDMQTIEHLEALQREAYQENASFIERIYGFDLQGGDEQDALVVYGNLLERAGDYGFKGLIECRESEAQDFLSTFGGLFFVGILLGILFLMATILIIYYKQVSEGYEDRSRYRVLQQVGMTKAEVRQSIRSQVLLVFFLPLITAGIHVAAAFPAVSRMLALFNLTNTWLFFWCTAICFAVFAVFYAIVYVLTARTYYRLVR